MKELPMWIFSAALAPALALSTAAFAADRDDRHGDEQRAGEQHTSIEPAGAFDPDGKTVTHRGADKNAGEARNLVFDEDGRVVGAVFQAGGFVKLGAQGVGLGWDHIEHPMQEETIK